MTGLAVVVALEFLPQTETAPAPVLAPDPLPVIVQQDPPADAVVKMLPGLPDTPLYSAKTLLRVDRVPKGPSAARTAFDRFSQAGYFGAFAMNDDGAFGWATRYSTSVVARRAALAICASHGPNCRIIAELSPVDSQGVPTANSLSYQQAQAYLSYAAKKPPAAMYIALDGAFGVETGKTAREAQSKARTICEQNIRRDNGLKDTQCVLLKAWD
jgi:hypothetical protein